MVTLDAGSYHMRSADSDVMTDRDGTVHVRDRVGEIRAIRREHRGSHARVAEETVVCKERDWTWRDSVS